ncbi:RBPJ-interacting and tubulin-associated protein 1 [Onychostruthus taczanowskii]|uniref:RBPJ-interacting and tubulin-associated protein 1 n=1 Tax=Onychostruthus taczanowskii TaxID=356909 RepID=UPI001B802875|nr:RBPJ-interacting and tubulin-associated protein 1 [Onychostruthus taczanowskii]
METGAAVPGAGTRGAGTRTTPFPSLPPPRGPRGRHRVRASFVDESLFGRPAGARPAPPAFPPPWAAPAAPSAGGSRPGSQCRSRSHAPSFCDESLFGAKPQGPAWAAPRMRKEDVAKLHSLLWSPPPAPRSQPGLSPRCRGAPLRAVPPPASAPPAASEPCRKESSRGCRHPGSEGSPAGWAAPGRGRSQSVSRLSTPPDRIHLSSSRGTERWKNQSAPTTPAAPQGPLVRGRSNSVSGSPVHKNAKAAGGCTARPPWK